MLNRAIITDKQQKAIFKYIETLRNGKQLKLMFGFNWLSGMRCINFAYLQVGDVIEVKLYQYYDKDGTLKEEKLKLK